VRYVRITSMTSLLLPKFVDALLGIVCSSQVPFSSVRVRSGCIGPRTLYRPWEEGRGGWAGLWLSTKTLQLLESSFLGLKEVWESGMVDLRRFPVSDGAGIKCGTFCTILDRKHFLDFLNYWFWKIGHVTTEYMEMSGIAVRIEWKHFRIPAGPSSGRNGPLKSRNLGFGHYGTFFQSLGKFEKWANQKKMLAWQSKVFLSEWKRFGVNRWPGGRAMSGNSAHPRLRFG